MSVLTTSQLTFCDLKDSYSIYMDTDCIGVACNSNGLVLESQTITINYHVLAGSTHVNASCEVSELPSGVTLTNSTSALDGKTGTIVLNVAQNATLGNEPTSSLKVVFKTNNADEFTFEKYITFVKYMKGVDGTDAVDFQIYSVDGFEFSDSLTTITLKTVAFKAGNLITSGATYQWFFYNRNTSDYEKIPDETGPELEISRGGEYASTNLKCVMEYDDILYEDHISLTEKTSPYTSLVKFFDGSRGNVFAADDLYLVAYVEVYQDGERLETIKANRYCSGVSTLSSSGVIVANIEETFSDGERMYFVCNINGIYEVVLGEYSSGAWHKVDYNTEYIYKNTIYSTIMSNVIAISKEDINKSRNVDFTIYKGDIPISNASVNVIDSNDPIISDDTPKGVVVGQLWLNTSITPNVLMIHKGNNVWEPCAEKVGINIFTSCPSNYSEGDLWILAKGESCEYTDSQGNQYIFKEGSMLKANTNSDIYVPSHWEDADKEGTDFKKNVNQTFIFNPSGVAGKGLPGVTIGQVDNEFYVNINSTEMGLYDNSNSKNPHQKVVYIKNNSATIKNSNLTGNTNFYGQINICDPDSKPDDADEDDVLFVWQVEDNKSFSLAIAPRKNN